MARLLYGEMPYIILVRLAGMSQYIITLNSGILK